MGDSHRMYRELARYYDLVYEGKDYRKEAAYFSRLARKFGRSAGRRWLDVACGTGRHLEHLRRGWDVRGVDASPEMLREARRRLPGVRFVRADMRSLELGTQFDVVSCLFSAIGHLRTEADLRKAFRGFARHLRPGGVLLLEPFLDPKQVISGHLSMGFHGQGTTRVARAARSVRRGDRLRIEYRYLIVDPERGIVRVDDLEECRLVAPARMVELLGEAGLRARVVRSPHYPERGMIVATAPRKR